MTLDTGRHAISPGDAPAAAASTPTGSGGFTGNLLVFLASGASLVLEIVAMRLVAPYVGVTLQTSSAVIGTALVAMALGAWAGGRLADRIHPGRVLAPVLVAGGVLTLLTSPLVRSVGSRLVARETPAVPAVLVLALLAVFVPATVLSTVTPMVVKLQLATLERTGSVVGRLSGVATLGAIVATFLTGFVLLARMRTSQILLGTGTLLVATGLALLVRRRPHLAIAATLLTVPVVPAAFALSPNPCQVETDYHCAGVLESPQGSTGRELHLDTLAHGYVDLADPEALAFEYVQTMAAVTDVVRQPGAPVDGLFIGGGAFSLPRYQAATRPGSRARVLEIDRGVVDLGRRRLGADEIPDLAIAVGDARTGVLADAANRYDLVYGDAFGGLAVPWHLATREAAQDIRRVLRPDGIYVLNVIDFGPDSFARAETATLRSVFPHVSVAADTNTFTGVVGGNHVLIASASPLPLERIAERLRTTTPGWTVLDEDGTAGFAGTAPVLTDDRAPVDQLLTTHSAA